MADHPDPHSPGPARIEPKKPLPGQDQNFPGQPPIVETDQGSRDPKRPPYRGDEDKKVENPGQRGHIESVEGVERELPPDR